MREIVASIVSLQRTAICVLDRDGLSILQSAEHP
jgi:hypothetical protein